MIIGSSRKLFHAKTRRVQEDHIIFGYGSKKLSELHGIKPHRVERMLAKTPAVADIGEPPDHVKFKRYAGYREIIEPIIRKYGINWAMFLGQTHRVRVSDCRHEAWTALHDAGHAYYSIGRFSMKDHTTVIHGVRKFRSLQDSRMEAAE